MLLNEYEVFCFILIYNSGVLQGDFLLVILKDLLERRRESGSPLKLILMWVSSSFFVMKVLATIELFCNSIGLCFRSWSPIIFHWLCCIQNHNLFPLLVHAQR